MSESKPRTTLRQRAVHYAQIGIFLTAVAAALSALGSLYWLLELTTHFRPIYAWIALACTVGCGIGRSWRWTIAGCVVTVWHMAGLAPYVPYARSSSEANLTLVCVNVLTTNMKKSVLIERLAGTRPDIILLQEVDTEWVDALDEALLGEYTHKLARPRSDNYGIAVYSRLPFRETGVIWQEGVPALHVTVDVNETPLSILNYHTLPPVTPDYARWRNEQLAAITAYREAHPGPVLVAGDLNCTMWSPHFTQLLRDAVLVDTRRGRGVLPTWFQVPFMGALLPVDHVLVSPEIDVVHLKTLGEFGSDHLPLYAEVKV